MRLTGVAIYRAIRRFGSSTLIPRTKETLNQYPFISNALIYGGLYSLAEVSRQTIKNSKSVIVGECDPKQDNSSNSAYDVDSIKRYAIMGTAGTYIYITLNTVYVFIFLKCFLSL